jgi:simple sugar transport system permease protein
VGVSFTFSAKLSNLGGEGQMCLGAIGMTIVGTSALGTSLGGWSIPLGMLAAALFGAVWAGIAGFVKTCFHASEIITTLFSTISRCSF